MSDILSQLVGALRAMLVHKATGVDHDQLARVYGLPRPTNFPESDWINALHELAVGPRGHPTATFRFVEMALRRYDEMVDVDVRANQPDRIYGSFDARHLGRLLRYEGGLYKVIEGAADFSWLRLARSGVSGVSYPFKSAGLSEIKTQRIRFLPFRVRTAGRGPVLSQSVPEYPVTHPADPDAAGYVVSAGTSCLYEVLLAPGALSLLVPPTYLRTGGAARTTDPLGGHLTPGADYDANGFRTAFPLYLDNGRRMRQLEGVLVEVLAAGVRPVIKLEGW